MTHGLRGFNGAVQRRLATLTVTMLISSCWQLSSEVELRRIFDVCKRWANSGLHKFVKKNMIRYMRPHGRFAHCSCKVHFYPCSALTARFGLLYRNILLRRENLYATVNLYKKKINELSDWMIQESGPFFYVNKLFLRSKMNLI